MGARRCSRWRLGPQIGATNSRVRNFAVWKQFVVPGNPTKSPLLLHPLATDAGGDHFHAGGKHWKSQDDPEWQTLAACVKTGSAQTASASSLDFEFYRTRVEPIF